MLYILLKVGNDSDWARMLQINNVQTFESITAFEEECQNPKAALKKGKSKYTNWNNELAQLIQEDRSDFRYFCTVNHFTNTYKTYTLYIDSHFAISND